MRRIVRGRHVDARSPRGYYEDFSSLADPRGPVDPDGLPRLHEPVDGLGHAAPDVARYALGNLEIYLENGSAERRERFVRAVEHLIRALERVPSSFGGWALPPAPRQFAELLGTGRLAAGAQGECLSAVVRGWTLLGVDGAEETAGAAFAAFTAPVEDGGFMREVGDPSDEAGESSPVMFEEYPIPGAPVMDLSGHARGALGVYDYWKASGDGLAGPLWRRSVSGLEFVVERYDIGYWTRDDLRAGRGWDRVSSIASLREHVLHLSAMSRLSGSDILGEAAGRWTRYGKAPVCALNALRARVTALIPGSRASSQVPRKARRE